jgi:hypothetical protein
MGRALQAEACLRTEDSLRKRLEPTEGAGDALQIDVETVVGEFAPGWF